MYSLTYDKYTIDPFNPSQDNPIEQMIKDDLNIDLEVHAGVGSYADWRQQFNARVALGDIPDIVFLRKEDLIKHAEDGLIIPLNELLKKTPELKNRLSDHEWLLTTVNKNIYGIPNLNPIGPYTSTYIRQDWLDDLQLELPETTDELFEVLKAFTEQVPEQKDIDGRIGFLSAESIEFVTLSPITNAFGLPQFGSTTAGIPQDWIDQNGELHFGPISEEYKNYLQYMNKLREANLLDPDMISNTFSVFKQKMIQGQPGVVLLFLPQQKMFKGNTWLNDIKRENPEANWVYLPPVKGPEGYFGNNTNSIDSSYSVALTRKVLEEPEKAEKAIELLNYMFRNGLSGGKGGQFIDFGLKGIHHLTENGKITSFTTKYYEDKDKYMNFYTMGGLRNNHDVLKIQITDEEFDLFTRMNEDRSKDNIITNYYYSSLPFIYEGDNYIREMSLKFIYGKVGFSEWDTYVKTLNQEYRYQVVQEIRKNELIDLGLLNTN